MTRLRIATFNLENLDDKPGEVPTLAERIAIMRPQFLRLEADVVCLQEVNGQEKTGQPRRLLALDQLLADTPYAAYNRVSTMLEDGSQVYDERNLVVLSRFPIDESHQFKHDFAPAPRYQKVTSDPPEPEPKDISWERPILHAKIGLPGGEKLNVINLHLKSKLPTNIAGQKVDQYTWRSSSAWAEGFFLSSMKRVGQAMETRILIDDLFEGGEEFIVVCGDFNADSDDVPCAAIRGDVEDTGNPALSTRVMVPCERTIPEPSRYSFLHRGRKNMLDHLMVSRPMLAHYKGAEIHNELLHDESIAFAVDKKYPESDHAPVVAEFELP